MWIVSFDPPSASLVSHSKHKWNSLNIFLCCTRGKCHLLYKNKHNMFAAQSSLSLWSHWNPQWNEQIKTETITSASGSKKWSESAFQTWKESNCQHVIRPTCTATTREVTFLTVPGVTVLAHEFPIEKKKKSASLTVQWFYLFQRNMSTEAFTAPHWGSSTGWEGANECACRYLITPSSTPPWQQRKWVQREASCSVKTFILSCADSCCCVYVGEQPV